MNSDERFFGKWASGRGITFPERFLQNLEFHKDGKSVKNQEGSEAKVWMWLDFENNVEMANPSFQIENPNGIIIPDNNVTVRGKSYGIVIPWSILKTYALWNRNVIGFTIVNIRLGLLELRPSKHSRTQNLVVWINPSGFPLIMLSKEIALINVNVYGSLSNRPHISGIL